MNETFPDAKLDTPLDPPCEACGAVDECDCPPCPVHDDTPLLNCYCRLAVLISTIDIIERIVSKGDHPTHQILLILVREKMDLVRLGL